ncbi:MAG TPA: hypothetical protein PKV72_00830 [Candidatus Peribacteria bacterium]|nr:hypothetical protein [Candidatus Peribacteria bacterium]
MLPVAPAAGSVQFWWTALCIVAAVNVCLWSASALLLVRGAAPRSAWNQLWLSAGYVFGCAFRSVFPRIDVSRAALVDSGLSTVLIGRSVATVAELCFCIQWALLLRVLARRRPGPDMRRESRILVCIIAMAECCSWYAVITTSYIGNAVEESLWAIAAVFLFVQLYRLMRGMPARLVRAIAIMLVPLGGYIVYMCTVDVPMYLSRWHEQVSVGVRPLTFAEGLHDLATRSVITAAPDVWRPEMLWMFLYFSGAVWGSVLLIHAARRIDAPRASPAA